MSGKITLGLVLSLGLGASFASSTNKAQKLIGNIDTSLGSLKKQKVDVKQFQQLARYGSIGQRAMKGLDSQLKANKIDTKNLTKETARLHKTMVSLRKIRRIDFNISAAKQKLASLKSSALAVVGIGYSINKLYASAADTIKAQGEIKTLGVSADGVNAITKAGHEMAMQYGQLTAPGFIKASYDIKSGIASLSDEGVKNFTKLAATTAVATKSTTSEMTKLYALGYGIFRKDFTSDNNFGEKFSGAIATAVKAFRTDGSDLAQGFSNIGASASSMGVSLAEQLSIIGVSKSSFNSASEAATSYRAFLDNVGKAQDTLGVSFTDASGKLLKMPEILKIIKGRFSDLSDVSQSDELKTAFGSAEAVKLIKGLIDKTDDLTASEVQLTDAMSNGAAESQKMAEQAKQGYGIERLSNGFKYLAFTVGKTLEPVFNSLAAAVSGVAKGIAWVSNTFPHLFSGIVIVGTTTLALVAGFKAWRLACAAVSFAKLNLVKNLETFKLATLQSGYATRFNSKSLSLSSVKLGALALKTKVFTAAQWLMNIALNANPIGLLITGVALLVGGLVLLYQKCTPVRVFLDGMWTGFLQGFAPVITSLKSFGGVFTTLGHVFSSLFGWVAELFPSLNILGDELGAIGSAGEMVGYVLGNAFSLALKPLTLLMDGVGWLGEKINGWLGDDEESDKGEQPGALKKTKLASRSPQNGGKNKADNKSFKPKYAAADPKVMNKAYGASRPQQTNHIQVTVQNPKSTVDVEKAITGAMANQHSNLSLADREF